MSSLSPLFADRTFNFPNTFGTRKTNTSTNPNPKDKSLGSHLKPTLPGAHLSALQTLGNILDQFALQPQEPGFPPPVNMW